MHYFKPGFHLVAVFLFLVSSTSIFGQLGLSTATLLVKAATNESITYHLKLSNPEVPVTKVQQAFLDKLGVLSCQADQTGTSLLIETSTDITHHMVISVARNVGCEQTYRQYKTELQAKRPSRIARKEIR